MDKTRNEILQWQENILRHLEKNLHKYVLISKAIIDCYSKPKFKKFNLLNEISLFLNGEDILMFEEVDTSNEAYSRIICRFILGNECFYLSISSYYKNEFVYIIFSFIRADNINDITEFEIKRLCK